MAELEDSIIFNSSTGLAKCHGKKTRMIDEFGNLLREEKFVDVTILCDQHVFRAHKLVLSWASPLLSELLKNNPSEEPVISFSDGVEWTHLTWILQYIYSGQVSVPVKHSEEFLKTARLLSITSLQDVKLAEETPPALKRPSTSEIKEEVAAVKKIRINRKVPKRKVTQIPRTSGDEIPIVISTKSLEGGPFMSASDLIPGQQQIIINAEPVASEIYADPNQEVIEIQTSHVDDMPVEEIVEVMTSSGVENTSIPEDFGDSFTPEVIVSETSPESKFKYLFAPSKAHLKPTHSLAPKKCNVCGKVYSNLSNLRQHINLVHTPHTAVKCIMCEKEFKFELYMRRHLICAHNIKPVKKDSTTKESRRLMSLKASPLHANVDDVFVASQKIVSEVESAVENLDQQQDQLS